MAGFGKLSFVAETVYDSPSLFVEFRSESWEVCPPEVPSTCLIRHSLSRVLRKGVEFDASRVIFAKRQLRYTFWTMLALAASESAVTAYLKDESERHHRRAIYLYHTKVS